MLERWYFKNSFIVTNNIYFSFILDNLISNAVKYAYPESKITVSVEIKSKCLSISICNRGSQIPTAELEEIFSPFYRNKDHETAQEGYGLGLAIVSKAAEILNIKIEVKSTETTCFTLIIPDKF